MYNLLSVDLCVLFIRIITIVKTIIKAYHNINKLIQLSRCFITQKYIGLDCELIENALINKMKHLERAVLTWKKKPEPNDEINLKANILLHSTQTISPKYTLKLKRFSLHCLWHCHYDSAHRSSMNAANQLHWFGFWLKPTSPVLIKHHSLVCSC